MSSSAFFMLAAAKTSTSRPCAAAGAAHPAHDRTRAVGSASQVRLERIIATSAIAVFSATYRPETGVESNRGTGTICRKPCRCSDAAALLRLDAGVLDDRPPLLDLGPLQGAECGRRLLIARRAVLAEIGGARAHDGIAELVDLRRFERRDHRRGRPGRRPQCGPDRDVEP